MTKFRQISRRHAVAHRRGSGFALVGAIAMLALFVMLGTAYVKYMMIELDDTRIDVDASRAQHLASGCIYAAIGEIEAAIDSGLVPKRSYTIKASAYRYEGGERAVYEQEIHVTLSDESARIDLNHAPPEVLVALGMDREAVERLGRAIPTPSGLRSESRRWLTSVDDLLTRGIVNRRQFGAIQSDQLTTYTVEDHSKPAAFLNLNTAEAGALAAILGIDDSDEIRQLMAKRPFESWQDAVTKSGREQSTFNLKSPRYASRETPREVAFSSRCFRLHSEVRVSFTGMARRPSVAAVEAVVLFKNDGSYSIRYWNERPIRLAEADAEQAEQAEDTEDTEAPGPSAAPESPETAGDGPEATAP